MNRFFELLQVAIGNRSMLSETPADEEWESLMETAAAQSLVGIAFAGVEKLPRSQWPPKQILRQWLGQSHVIEQRNVLTTDVCLDLCRQFEEDGFRICVLKGQANHAYYPAQLANRRSCGDIDLWAVPNDVIGNRDGVRKVIEYVKAKYGLKGLCHLHVNSAKVRGIPVEVHFHPSFMNDPLRNKRFQKFFADIDSCVCCKEIEGGTVPAMRVGLDSVFQMNHIYRHLIDEGVGLRQVLDYYFLCDSFYSSVITDGNWADATRDIMVEVGRMGMKRFAGALMYVLREVFGMSEERMLCPVCEKDGRFLLSEIMTAGNFGHSDPRMAPLEAQGSRLHLQLSRAWRRFKRNLRFLTSYPGEVIWEPFARMWHYAWKSFKLWKI